MIRLEQIKLLESRVNKAVELIRHLREENGKLRKGVESAQVRIQELERVVEEFRTDQREIEKRIVRVLTELDQLEDSVAAREKEPPRGAEAQASAAEAARRLESATEDDDSAPEDGPAEGAAADEAPESDLPPAEDPREVRGNEQDPPPSRTASQEDTGKNELDIF